MSESIHVAPAAAIKGELSLPGDKSISHRALLCGLYSPAPVTLYNLALSADVRSTAVAVAALGAKIEQSPEDPVTVRLRGPGLGNIAPPAGPIDCGNADTLARLVCGVLAGVEGTTRLVGDESLSARPMTRVTGPLTRMGASFVTTDAGTLPIEVTGRDRLTAISYELPMASAQVQGAILFAGLSANGPVSVTEPAPIRDHSERMLRRCGVRVERRGSTVTLTPPRELQLPDTRIPADPSSASPFVVASALLHGSFLRIPGVGANITRTGLFDVLERMGARLTFLGRRTEDGEPVADLEVSGGASAGQLIRTTLQLGEIPRMIDELPLFGLLAHFCKGETVVRGAEELRHKESDRITLLVAALRGIGVNAEERADGFVVRGSGARPEGGEVHSGGDHRIAMLGAIAGLVSRRGVTVHDPGCVSISFPGFFDVLERVSER